MADVDSALMPPERGTVIPNTHTAAVPGWLGTQWLDFPLRRKVALFVGGSLVQHTRVFVGHRDLTERRPWISYEALVLVYEAVDAVRSHNYEDGEALLGKAGFYHNHVTLRTHAGHLYAYLKEHQN